MQISLLRLSVHFAIESPIDKQVLGFLEMVKQRRIKGMIFYEGTIEDIIYTGEV